MKDKSSILALICCCLVCLCLGSIYSWSVFSQAMADYLTQSGKAEVSAADLALVYTVANCVGPVTMILGGRINEAIGPRLVIIIGGLMFGGGMALSSLAASAGFLMVSFGLIGGLGLGMAYGSAITTAVKLYPARRGLMGGITTAAYGISSVILPPIVSALVAASSARTAFLIVGTVFAIVITLSALMIREPKAPSDMSAGGREGSGEISWKHMIRMPHFYAMLLLLICGAFSGMMVISQASAIAVTMMDMSAARAAIVVSVLAMFNTLGRIAAGSISDRIGRVGTLRLACVISALAQGSLLISAGTGIIWFYMGTSLVGLAFGAFMGVYPGFTADNFGLRNNGVNYGIMCIGFALAGFVGPQIARSCYAASGSYKAAFIYACIFSLAGIVFTFVYRVLADRSRG